jgi:hypothetical protein
VPFFTVTISTGRTFRWVLMLVVIHSVSECLRIAECSCIVRSSKVALSHWLLQTATQVMLCVRHRVQWDERLRAVQLMFRMLIVCVLSHCNTAV